jgi:hypothetical protein
MEHITNITIDLFYFLISIVFTTTIIVSSIFIFLILITFIKIKKEKQINNIKKL